MAEYRYLLRGRRQGFEIRPTDQVEEKPDGYTVVRRGGVVVGIYRTSLLSRG